jgi:hypothetical protein
MKYRTKTMEIEAIQFTGDMQAVDKWLDELHVPVNKQREKMATAAAFIAQQHEKRKAAVGFIIQEQDMPKEGA